LLCKDKQKQITNLATNVFIAYMWEVWKSHYRACVSQGTDFVLIKYKQVIFRHQSVKFCFCPPGCLVFVLVGQVQEWTATHELKWSAPSEEVTLSQQIWWEPVIWLETVTRWYSMGCQWV